MSRMSNISIDVENKRDELVKWVKLNCGDYDDDDILLACMFGGLLAEFVLMKNDYDALKIRYANLYAENLKLITDKGGCYESRTEI